MSQTFASLIFVLSLAFLDLTQAQGVAKAHYSSDYGFMRGAPSGRCLTVLNADMNNGGEIILYDCLVGSQNQHLSESAYKFVKDAEDYRGYKFRQSGKCLTVKDAKTENNTPIIQWECTESSFPNSKNQLFTKVKSSKAGHFSLKGLNSGKCVTVLNADTAQNSKMILYDCIDGPNQQFADVFCNI